MIKIIDLMNHMAKPVGVSKVKPELGRVRIYIGNKASMEAFQAFIMGYRAAAPSSESSIWMEFDRWARGKLGINGCHAQSIFYIVSKMRYGAGQKGVAKMLELWREYEATLGNVDSCNSERQEDQKEGASQMGCTSQ